MNEDEQFDVAEEVTSLITNLLPEKGEEFHACQSHLSLGMIYQTNGETEKAVHHLEVAIKIAIPFSWHDQLLSAHLTLAQLFLSGGRLDDAQAHIERAKSHVADSPYLLGVVMEAQVAIWCKQYRLEEARSEALRAADVYEKLGSTEGVENCRRLLQSIEVAGICRSIDRVFEEPLDNLVSSGHSSPNCELLQIIIFPACTNSSEFREPNDAIDGCAGFLRFIGVPQVANPSLCPSSCSLILSLASSSRIFSWFWGRDPIICTRLRF